MSELILDLPFLGLRRHHYGAILCDPPWNFKTRSDKGKGRSAERHYDTMDLAAIKALPVGELAARDCVLFMWITDAYLGHAMDVLRAWGFCYKTVGFYWAKTNPVSGGKFIGMGFWTRANPEQVLMASQESGNQCLLATAGAPKRVGKDVRKLIESPRREHSRKPDEIYLRIERLVDGPYLDLFARESHPGWKTWGLEQHKFDEQKVIL